MPVHKISASQRFFHIAEHSVLKIEEVKVIWCHSIYPPTQPTHMQQFAFDTTPLMPGVLINGQPERVPVSRVSVQFLVASPSLEATQTIADPLFNALDWLGPL